ncbi:MAG: M20/M25/M40 family metallo-hydrolase [Propionibacteriales bacterium]|nr:M20/M25/M40 family metallo-hydrolase [Propionibacteriales bacterium]
MAAALAVPALADAPTDTTQFRDAVTVEGVRDHQAALQAIADANGGTRASSTPGYDASVDYVTDTLIDAGYQVSQQEFDYELFVVNAPSVLDPTSPDQAPYVDDEDFIVMEYSGEGDVTAAVQAVDLTLPPTAAPSSTSGCEAADFAGFTAGNIALMQRGTCTFREKADFAAAAGAVGAIIFNEGQEGRTDLLSGTLSPPQAGIPVVGTTFEVGNEIAGLAASSLTVRLATDVEVRPATTTNVIADSTSGRTDRTLVVGAHLDSVLEGPGINDNGSGSAAILETAEELAELGGTRNAVRFTFWGAEESGLIGSQHYVDQLAARDLKNIRAYLNFDMVGSPNFVRFVYDGDGSAFGVSGPNGSGHIEQTFVDYFASQELASEPTQFDGRSDYDAFINAGVPAGGLFTGAEGVKTAEQAATYGGTAGLAYDPCYHQACDTFANNSDTGLDQMTDAIAHTTLLFAQTKSAINGTGEATTKLGEASFRGHVAVK